MRLLLYPPLFGVFDFYSISINFFCTHNPMTLIYIHLVDFLEKIFPSIVKYNVCSVPKILENLER